MQADRLPGLLAIAVGPIVEARQCCIDLGNQLPLTITRAEFHPALGLRARSIRKVGMLRRFLVQVSPRLLRRAKDFIPPSDEFTTEICALTVAHEGLVVGRTVLLANLLPRPNERLFRHQLRAVSSHAGLMKSVAFS